MHLEVLEDRRLLTTYMVNSLADNLDSDGFVTLREAVYAANSDSQIGDAPPGTGPDIIQFDPSLAHGTIFLTMGNELVVAATPSPSPPLPDLTIIGLGKNLLTINAGPGPGQTGLCRHFEVNPGAALAMSDLTLTNGNAGEGANGGAIYCDGTLDLTDVVLSGNRAGKDGGAIYATTASPALTLTGCDVTGNQAVGNGGGIDQLAGTLTITGGNVNLNTAVSYGGGVYATGSGSVAISGASFTGNQAPGSNDDGGNGRRPLRD